MSLHKLTAGDGYEYLTRQVAAMDATASGRSGLDSYYSEKGESPGVWMGAGLDSIEGICSGDRVTQSQMRALFGEGLHPDAERITARAMDAGVPKEEALKIPELGRPFPKYDGVNVFREACRARLDELAVALNLPRGSALPDEDCARVRTEVGRELFVKEFDRTPADARELAGFIARSSRPAQTAVAGYDLTFSPVKSISTLWAIADRAISEEIQQAHSAAVADVISWIEREVAYTRRGAACRQVDVNGVLATAFTHRDARSGDPDLHTHVAVSNKVQALDGTWLALDGRVLHKAAVAASERYNTRIEAELIDRLGVQFAERQGTDARKRPIREIVGIDERLNARWSSRRAAIDLKRAELAVVFQADHGRPPTPVEALKLAQQATLSTRQRKHEPRSLAEQRAAWRAEALDTLGGQEGIDQMVHRAIGAGVRPVQTVNLEWVHASAGTVISALEATRATWQTWHVRAEAERLVRGSGVHRSEIDTAVDQVVEAAQSPALSLHLGRSEGIIERPELTRRNGQSVYEVAGSQLMSSPAIIAAEQRIIRHAKTIGGAVVPAETVDIALLESSANGVTLNAGQVQMVRDLAMSGSRLQLAIAPAGSGKTTAMRVLADAWVQGGGVVLGLAPTAVAAALLGEEIDSRAETLAKLSYSLNSPRTSELPDWIEQIGPSTLVIVDEAGMAGTLELDRVCDFVMSRGGSIRLVGDDQQLAAVAAGGVLRDIAEQAGASTLKELMRFQNPAESAATLKLRTGDSEALGFYLDQGRVQVGDETTMVDAAYAAWKSDQANGYDAVMLAPTRDLVSDLNARARQDRLAAVGGDLGGPIAALADGNDVSAGDVVITRTNNRRLPITSSDWVKNGDRWIVESVADNGQIRVKHLTLRRSITLPARYVRESVELGYASTVHGAQGMTTGRSHVIATGQESRQLFYVAMSRGREENRVYLTVVGDGDPHSVITPETISPATPTEILTSILNRDQAPLSASTSDRQLSSVETQLGQATERYRDALGFAAEDAVDAAVLRSIDVAAEQVLEGLTECPAYATLRTKLAIISLSGQDPVAALQAAAKKRELGTAEDPAAVLEWRLDISAQNSTTGGPLPWLTGIPQDLAGHPVWGDYLQARLHRVHDLAIAVRGYVTERDEKSALPWAAGLRWPESESLLGDLAVWRAAMNVDRDDARPTGKPQLAVGVRRYQERLEQATRQAQGQRPAGNPQWAAIADAANLRITQDPHWPAIADRFDAVERAGIDLEAHLGTVLNGPELPDDLPAAALWWRVVAQLPPAVVAHIMAGGEAETSPAWVPSLLAVMGPIRGEALMEDSQWPQLAAAIDHAVETADGKFSAEQILDLAVDQLPESGQWHADTSAQFTADLLHCVRAVTEPLSSAPSPDQTSSTPDSGSSARLRALADRLRADGPLKTREKALLERTTKAVESDAVNPDSVPDTRKHEPRQGPTA
jgi:conjugative relaxase-like TrwC/TraI family protein